MWLLEASEWKKEYQQFVEGKFPNIQGKVRELLLTHATHRAWIWYWTGSLSSRLYSLPENQIKRIKMAAMLFWIVMRNIDNLTDDESFELPLDFKIQLLRHYLRLLSGESDKTKYDNTPSLHELELLAVEFQKLVWNNNRLCDALKKLEWVVERQLFMKDWLFDEWLKIARDTWWYTSTMTIGFGQFFASWENEKLNQLVFHLGSWMQISDDIMDRGDDMKRWQKTFATEFSELSIKGIEQEYRNQVFLALKWVSGDERDTVLYIMRIFRTLNWINSIQWARRVVWRKFGEIPTPLASS